MPKVKETKITIDGKEMFAYNHPRPSVAVDCVILGIEKPYLQDVKILLVTRGNEPYKGFWALPGGFLEMHETTAVAASRELLEETNVSINPKDMRLVGVYDRPGRDPRGRVISIAYASPILYIEDCELRAGSDAAKVGWVPICTASEISFDHDRIIDDAIHSIPPKYLAGMLRHTNKEWVDNDERARGHIHPR